MMASWLILSSVLLQISNVLCFMNIRVNNGESEGVWGTADRCDLGTFAVGYDIKVEDRQAFPHDNTALNGIKLICQGDNGASGGKVTSTVGPWGRWLGESYCEKRNVKNFYLTGFTLKVHKTYNDSSLKTMSLSEALSVTGPDDYMDNTAVNNIRFKCRDREATEPSYELPSVRDAGPGERGQYGELSKECPAGQAVCGIATRVDDGEYRNFVDDTALNDVMFHCCQTDPFEF